jgi:nuclear pore complex protein Nup54
MASTGTSSSSFFGATSVPSFAFAAPSSSQQTQTPSFFGGGATAASFGAPSFSFTTPFSGQNASSQAISTPAMFGQFSGVPQASAPPPDDSAVKELQSIKDSFVNYPGNYRHRFHYLFLNVIDNPAARMKPPEVDELEWREALRRAGGVDNPDKLWPVEIVGFKGLLARKAAQDEAIKEYTARLDSLQTSVAEVATRHVAVLRVQLEDVKKRHLQLCHQLLRTLKYIDALEGRFARAVGFQSSTSRQTFQVLNAQLKQAEESLAPGLSHGLVGRIDALMSASKLQAGLGGKVSLTELEALVDEVSLNGAFKILGECADALSRLQSVLKRNEMYVSVLQELNNPQSK